MHRKAEKKKKSPDNILEKLIFFLYDIIFNS